MLQPVVRRTWAPRGQTPVHRSWDRHDRLSVIAAITLAPRLLRLGLYFGVLKSNFNGVLIFRFLLWMLRTLRRPVVFVMDRLSAHRMGVRLLHEHLGAKAHLVQVEWLPAYAPELNPVENLWCRTKHGQLPNFIPQDIDHLAKAVDRSLYATRATPGMLRSFFKKTGLEL